MARASIFLSYSHADERLKERLVTQLKVLEYATLVELWNDDRIAVGGDWKREIDRAMARARIALLLVTADFLSSPFILNTEVPELLERHRSDGLQIYPVIARPCAWKAVGWLSDMQVRPKGGRPVWGGSARTAERELAAIAEEIAAAFMEEPEPSAGAARPVGRESTAESSIEAAGVKMQEWRGGLSHPVKLAYVDEALRTAIAHGAPLYNRGDVAACAEIYRQTAGALLSALREAVSDNMLVYDEMQLQDRAAYKRNFHVYMVSPRASPSPEIQMAHDELYRVHHDIRESDEYRKRRGEARVEWEDDREAWELRHVFDHVHFVSEALKAVGSIERPQDDSDAARRNNFAVQVIDAANTHGRMIYQEGLRRGRSWIKGCAVVYLNAELILSQHLPAAVLTQVSSLMAERRAAGGYAAREWLAPQARGVGNAYEVAWLVRHAFDLLLDRLRQDEPLPGLRRM